MLSALFASRSIPNQDIILNDTIFLEIYNLEKDHISPTYFIPIKKESIYTNIGKVNTIKCKIYTQKSRIFSDKNSKTPPILDDGALSPPIISKAILIINYY